MDATFATAKGDGCQHDCPPSLDAETERPKMVATYDGMNAVGSLNASCLAPVETAAAHALGVLRHQFPGLCAARVHRDGPQGFF